MSEFCELNSLLLYFNALIGTDISAVLKYVGHTNAHSKAPLEISIMIGKVL